MTFINRILAALNISLKPLIYLSNSESTIANLKSRASKFIQSRQEASCLFYETMKGFEKYPYLFLSETLVVKLRHLLL